MIPIKDRTIPLVLHDRPSRPRPFLAVARIGLSIVAVTAGGSGALAGPAVGQFELKDLEAEEGSVQLQSQNAYSFGEPPRQVLRGAGGEPVYDENTVVRLRHALEVEMGYSRHFKTRIGIEFEKERLEEPPSMAAADSFDALTLSEVGFEGIVILKRREGDGLGLGMVAEVEYPFENGEDLSLFLGTIVELGAGPWSMTLQPMVVHFFGGEAEDGERKDDKWDFAYAAKLEYALTANWSLSLEAYGTVDRLGSTGNMGISDRLFGDHDQHRIGPILYHAARIDGEGAAASEADEGTVLTVGLGFLAGLTEDTPDGTVKLSVELDY